MSIQTPQAIRGTQDIFGPEAEAFAFVVETFERVRKLYRFRRAEPQVFKAAKAFVRDGLGGDLLSCDHTRRNATGVIATVNAAMLDAAMAHAVLAARDAMIRGADDLLVAFGDTPLISAETFARLRAPLRSGRGRHHPGATGFRLRCSH